MVAKPGPIALAKPGENGGKVASTVPSSSARSNVNSSCQLGEQLSVLSIAVAKSSDNSIGNCMGKRQEKSLSVALLGEPFPLASAVASRQKVLENRYQHFLQGEQCQHWHPRGRAICRNNCMSSSSSHFTPLFNPNRPVMGRKGLKETCSSSCRSIVRAVSVGQAVATLHPSPTCYTPMGVGSRELVSPMSSRLSSPGMLGALSAHSHRTIEA